MSRAHKVFLATAYPPPDLVKSMKRFLACLALCASLSASAQNDNCTVLGIQDLTQMVIELQSQLDSVLALSAEQGVMTRDSVVGIAWRKDLRNANLIGSNLSFENLEGARLTHADLSEGDLESIVLRYTEADSAVFDNTRLVNAEAAYGSFRGASFVGASVNDMQCQHCDLTGADFTNAVFSAFEGQNANFTNANFYGAQMSAALLNNAVLTGATIECLRGGAYASPWQLPNGYVYEPDPNCPTPDRYRIVPE